MQSDVDSGCDGCQMKYAEAYGNFCLQEFVSW